MVLKDKIGRIVKIIPQKPVENHIGARGIRLDILVEDESGKVYDIEMQTTSQRNLPRRMRYYQCAIDGSLLDRGQDYNELPDTFIIFFCTFDYMDAGLPLYTVESVCRELAGSVFEDGISKVIVNSRAAEKAESELGAFLRYMNGQEAATGFTREVERQVQAAKEDEERRREYMLIQSFEMDARREGLQQGMQQGLKQGFSDGARQTRLETAAALKNMGLSSAQIAQVTGLSSAEIAKL